MADCPKCGAKPVWQGNQAAFRGAKNMWSCGTWQYASGDIEQSICCEFNLAEIERDSYREALKRISEFDCKCACIARDALRVRKDDQHG